MTLIRTGERQRLTEDNRPAGCPAFSAGQFVIRADGTGRFDRHYHDFHEFWLVAAGSGTVQVGDLIHDVVGGDIIYTPAGAPHDILTVTSPLHVFWVSLNPPAGGSGQHLHLNPADTAKHPVPVTMGDVRG